MRRAFASNGVVRHGERPVRSIACIAFVAVLGIVFWAGLVWIAGVIARLSGPAF